MKKGDIIEIDGSFGFLFNPTLEVLEVKGDSVKVQSIKAKDGGLLSHTNQSWHSIDILENKRKKLST